MKIFGTAKIDQLADAGDDDILIGLGGDDVIFASHGGATVIDGAGNDKVVMFGGGRIIADVGDPSGNDTYVFAPVLNGQPRPSAILSYASAQQDLVIDLANGFARDGSGLIGEDKINGFTQASGGSGNDKLNGTIFADTLWGGAGNDEIMDESVGQSGSNSYFGGAGDDAIRSGGQGDHIWDGAGKDYANIDGWGTIHADASDASDDFFTLTGDASKSLLSYARHTGGITIMKSIPTEEARISGATAGNDVAQNFTQFAGGSGNDVMNVGHDDYTGEGPAHRLNGNGGDDELTASQNFSVLSGGAGDDLLTANWGNMKLLGGSGDDTLTGPSGPSDENPYWFGVEGGEGTIFDGGAGKDWIKTGDDVFVVYDGAGSDEVVTGYYRGVIKADTTDSAGNDTYRTGTRRIYDDEGPDYDALNPSGTVSYATAAARIVVNLDAGTATGANIGTDTLYNMNHITGGRGADHFEGSCEVAGEWSSSSVMHFNGRGGNDTFIARAGRTIINGGDGGDRFTVERGTVAFSGGAGNDSGTGGGGNDCFIGGGGSDTFIGGAGRDLFKGGGNDDRFFGGDGDDTAYGDNGDDVLTGNKGDDVLAGGAGVNRMTGGQGADTFMILQHDILYWDPATYETTEITDFQNGVDKIGVGDLYWAENFEGFVDAYIQEGPDANSILLQMEIATVTIHGLTLATLDASDMFFF